MKLLVTGGAGFIGSCFILGMLQKHQDWTIACLDKLTYAGNLDNLSSLKGSKRFSFHLADIASEEDVARVFEETKPEVVVNFAAESHVDRSISEPGLFVRTNVKGAAVLLEAALQHGVQRFHQVSTDEVYGELPLDRPELLFYEDSILKPSSPYSASKAAADLLALSYHRTYGLPVTITRSSNNYGPRQFPEKLIPLMVIKALKGEKLPIYGDGLNVRDWMHVEDNVRAIETVLLKGQPGEIYNAGARNEKNNLEITGQILSLLKMSDELITHTADRKGHDRRYAVATGKLESLGWKCEVSFQSGLQSTVDWYLSHRQWWQDILSGAYRRRKEL